MMEKKKRRKTKAETIRETLKATKEKRKNQKPLTFVLKLQNLSKKKEKNLNKAFLEAKWLYNSLVCNLQSFDLNEAHKIRKVQVKVKDGFLEKNINLGSQIKQEIADRLKDNLLGLKKLKEKGHKVGCLKPKKFVNSIPLKQYEVTFKFDFCKNKVRIQKLGSFRVLGLHQIPYEAEISNAILVRKPSGFYLHVTCYLDKDFSLEYVKDRKGRKKPKKKEGFSKPAAVDFGIENKLTLSNGIKIDYEIRESERLKKIQRELSRTKRGSRNREKVKQRLRREYQREYNIRKDCQNRIFSYLSRYDRVIFQDDNIRGWEVLFGREVHSSGIGGMKSRLRASLETSVLDRVEPTTKECFLCGNREDMPLSKRIFKCSKCGCEMDRDWNSALVELRKGYEMAPEHLLRLGWAEVKPVERSVSARIFESPYIRVSSLYEAGSPRL